jgi:hypothetical protein
MDSSAMTHTKFHKDSPRRSKVDTGDIETRRQQGDLISLLLFFPNKGTRLKVAVFGNLFFPIYCHSDILHLEIIYCGKGLQNIFVRAQVRWIQ